MSRLLAWGECVGGGQIFFFFQSRGRHTSCYRDWSSDVCSSDLPRWTDAGDRRPIEGSLEVRVHGTRRVRSEERRVGKEWRSRWAPDPLKKKKKKMRSATSYILTAGPTAISPASVAQG